MESIEGQQFRQTAVTEAGPIPPELQPEQIVLMGVEGKAFAQQSCAGDHREHGDGVAPAQISWPDPLRRTAPGAQGLGGFPKAAVGGDGEIQIMLLVIGELPFQFLGMPEVIHIKKGHQRGLHFRQAPVAGNGGQLAVEAHAGGKPEQTKAWIGLDQLLGQLGPLIEGSMVDEQAVPVGRGLATQILHQARQKSRRIAEGSDDRDSRHSAEPSHPASTTAHQPWQHPGPGSEPGLGSRPAGKAPQPEATDRGPQIAVRP